MNCKVWKMNRILIFLILITQLFNHCLSSANNVNLATYLSFCKSLKANLTCDLNQKYRPIDGVCNNLIIPFSGASNTRLSRLLPARYSDGISAPPKSVTGVELPSTRLLSLAVFNDTNSPNPLFTVALLQFAQVIAHDISSVLKAPAPSGCCSEYGQLDPIRDESCLYIPVPSIDTVHPGQECLNFRRSLTDYDIKCPKLTRGLPAEQINDATGSLDLSNIYGSTIGKMKLLRSFKNGKLKVENRYNMDWPPRYPFNDGTCSLDKPQDPCYLSGDPTINQNPGIAIIDTLFIREHNRIAKELKKLNPHWSDEILFQESRRINIAQYQNIAFYKWFGCIVSENGIKRLGLKFVPSGGEYADRYNASVFPVSYNEFAAGVFRFPHTLIEGHLK